MSTTGVDGVKQAREGSSEIDSCGSEKEGTERGEEKRNE